ncbi:MAG: PP2C family protein-serine/threonine phosphatase, partial [Planctomycetes bacterium]|nr:PP2C family protein-serine/threonine phosphatase [Planctomycetota bacterium]
VRNATGVVSHFVSVGRDITDRRKAAEADSRHLLARAVQQRLFPASPPAACGYDIAGAVYTADKTGGDYYDYLSLPDGCTGIVVGDVSGHAFDAAFVMAETRAYLRSIAQTSSDPGEILTLVNRALVADTADNQFVTLVLCSLDPASHALRYASAGHVTGVVLGKTGAVKAELPSTGLPLGLFPNQSFTTASSPSLEPGDIVALFTDGVIETDTAEGVPFGSERPLDVIRRYRREPAAKIVHRLYRAVRDFAGRRPHADDITAVICKVDPRP